MSASDAERRADELEALCAIFGPNVVVSRVGASAMASESATELVLAVSAPAPLSPVSLLVHLPGDYPSGAPPVVLSADARWLGATQCAALVSVASDALATVTPGEEALFVMMDTLGERVGVLAGENKSFEPAREAGRADRALLTEPRAPARPLTAAHALEPAPRIARGPTVTDRKSRFVAHLARCRSSAELEAFRAAVLADKRVEAATHNILAFRYVDAAGVLHEGRDDDGESRAGDQLLDLLALLAVVDVAVIVTRWFGGIELGPDRFKHICGVARALATRGGLVPGREAEADPDVVAALGPAAVAADAVPGNPAATATSSAARALALAWDSDDFHSFEVELTDGRSMPLARFAEMGLGPRAIAVLRRGTVVVWPV